MFVFAVLQVANTYIWYVIKMCLLFYFFSWLPPCGLATTTSTARALTAHRRWTERWVGPQYKRIFADFSFCLNRSLGPRLSEQTTAATAVQRGRVEWRPPSFYFQICSRFLSTCKSWQISFRDRESNLIWFMPWRRRCPVENGSSRRNVHGSADLQPWNKNMRAAQSVYSSPSTSRGSRETRILGKRKLAHPLLRCSLAGHKHPVVVLLLQAGGVHGHLLLHSEEEQPPGHISPRLPPHQHAQHLVVRHELDPLRPLWVFQPRNIQIL